MRIALFSAGAGRMYCGSCLQSGSLAAALSREGYDAVVVPLYAPLRLEDETQSARPVAFGAISAYLRACWPALGWLARWARPIVDHPAVLRWASRHGGAVRPERVGQLAVSVLEGESGPHRREIERLADHAARELQPDVVHLSTALLAGFAGTLQERLGVPVVASLSGEDGFVERLGEPLRGEVRRRLARQAAQLDALIAPSRYYADFMADYLGVPGERIRVIRPGLRLDDRPAAAEDSLAENDWNPATVANPPQPASRRPAVVGFLSRVCREKGLALLAEAVCRLAADPACPPVQLRAAGYLDPADRAELRAVERRMAAGGLADRFRYVGELDLRAKREFLAQLDVFALPTLRPESKGLPVLEAWAEGVPVVASDHGALGEWMATTGGGVRCAPGNAESLASALRGLLADRPRAAQLGRQARRIVREQFTAERMAREMAEVYRALCNAPAGAVPSAAAADVPATEAGQSAAADSATAGVTDRPDQQHKRSTKR